jgi:hypothetical protein
MKTSRDAFRFAGQYQIITMRKRPAMIPLSVWLWLRRHGFVDSAVLATSPVHHNLIMLGTDTGLNLFMQHLSGDPVYPIELTSASIGTDDTAPANGDTDLGAPVTEGIQRAYGELTAVDTFYSEWFISNDELPNGEYKEFGLFAGTQLFCRSLIEAPTHTKASNEDTLITYTITASNV